MTTGPTGWTLNLERHLPAPPERVFGAFLDADDLAQWWGPQGFSVPSVELDGREGTRYRIAMQPPDGDRFHLSGEIREVDPPRRLVYTFAWEEPDPDDRETVVTLTFEPDGEGTMLLLRQGSFATEARHALHEAGWTETLDRLEASLASH